MTTLFQFSATLQDLVHCGLFQQENLEIHTLVNSKICRLETKDSSVVQIAMRSAGCGLDL